MDKVRSPCRDCATRSVGCHSKCKLYREYKDKREAEKTLRKDVAAEYGHVKVKEKMTFNLRKYGHW